MHNRIYQACDRYSMISSALASGKTFTLTKKLTDYSPTRENLIDALKDSRKTYHHPVVTSGTNLTLDWIETDDPQKSVIQSLKYMFGI